MFGQLICKNFKLRVERFHIKGFKDEYNEIGFDLKFIFTIQKNILTPLTLSRGGGKNAFAKYFSHMSVILSWIRVVSKANVKSTCRKTFLQKF